MFEESLLKLEQKLSSRVGLPDENKDYLFIDFLEFYAIFYGDDVTKSELMDYLRDNGIDICKFFPSLMEKTYNSLTEEEYDNDDEYANDELDNIRESAINHAFSCLTYRSQVLMDKYPFEIESNKIILKSNFSIFNRIYILLLFSSMLNRFSEIQHDLTKDFESITYCALTELFPSYTIREFGKNGDYTGFARDKIRALAKDMNLMVDEEGIKSIHKKNQQEKGLDIVLWKGFSDCIPNMIIYLVQCACGKNWTHKFSEAKRYYAYLAFRKPNPNTLFSTSYALSCHGKFTQNDDVISSESLFLDRLRIMDLLNSESCLLSKSLTSLSYIDKVINFKIAF